MDSQGDQDQARSELPREAGSHSDGSDVDNSYGDAVPAPKRQRVLACQRCRHRKQKCDGDGQAPCSNCSRADEECLPTRPVRGRTRFKEDYIQSLEQRIGQLERLVPSETRRQSSNGLAEDPAAEMESIPDDRSVAASAPLSVDMVLQNTSPIGSAPLHQHVIDTSITPDGFVDNRSEPSVHSERSRGIHGPLSQSSGVSAAHTPQGPHPRRLTNRERNVTQVMNNNFSSERTIYETRPTPVEDYTDQLTTWPDSVPREVEDHLVHVYFENANRRFPFLFKDSFCSWHARWRQSSYEHDHNGAWEGFFVKMLFAVSLFLDPKNTLSMRRTSQRFYDQAVKNHLPAVLEHSNRLLHVQAYLMMSLHALFSPSSERLSLMISSAVRHCVVAQYHLAEAEPECTDAATQVEIQMRRRAFWTAYCLDRVACGVFRLPYSIAEDNITVPLFDNIDDSALLAGLARPATYLPDVSLSTVLHRAKCLRIQSEILNMSMRVGLAINFESMSEWRSHILSKLEEWRSELQQAAESNTKRFTDSRWMMIVFNHCLLYLHDPNKLNVCGPAGDWSIRASIHTILIFRQFQSYRTMPHPITGLVSQFTAGIIILYCLWATPPSFRSESYNSKSIFEAIRACSNTLAIITERWESTGDLSDVFEILVTEIPLAETPHPLGERTTKRVSEAATGKVRSKLPRLKSTVLNWKTIRMIEEMITEDFPLDRKPSLEDSSDALGSSIDQDSTGLIDCNQQLFANSIPLYDFPNLFLFDDGSPNQLGMLSPEQGFGVQGGLTGWDLF